MSRISPAGGDGPAVTWLQQDANPVGIELAAGESVTVPSGEDWMVALHYGNQGTINGSFTIAPDPRKVNRVVFPEGTSISFEYDGGILHGWDVSGVDKTVVSGVNPTVPTGETWVGGFVAEDTSSVTYDINGQQVALPTADLDSYAPTGFWTVLESGDSLGSAFFGGFKI